MIDKKVLAKKYLEILFQYANDNTDKFFISCVERTYAASKFVLYIVPYGTQIHTEEMNELKKARKENGFDVKDINLFYKAIDTLNEKHQENLYEKLCDGIKIAMSNRGISKYDIENDLVSDLNEHILSKLFKNTTKEEQDFIAKNMLTFNVKPYTKDFSLAIKLLKNLKKEGYQELTDKMLENIPPSIIDINTYRINELLPKIVELLRDYKNDDDVHNELLNLMSRRAYQVKKSKGNELEVRNALLSVYNNNIEKLEDYAKDFKSVKQYVEHEKALRSGAISDSVIVDNQDDIITVSINYNKFKAAIPHNWSTYEYKGVLENFCKVIEKKDNNIIKINRNILKVGNNMEHFVLYISTKNSENIVEKLTQEEMKNRINSFTKALQGNSSQDVFKEEYVSKWFESYKLENVLQSKDITAVRRKKI